MGHMTLIADDVVKLFSHYREEIYEVVQTSVPQPDWDRFVAGTLRETRERDITPLGGGNINAGGDTSLSGAISDDDDEFPMNSARTSKAIPAKQGGSGSPELSTNDSGAPSDQVGDSSKLQSQRARLMCCTTTVLALPRECHLERPRRQLWQLRLVRRRRTGMGHRQLARRRRH